MEYKYAEKHKSYTRNIPVSPYSKFDYEYIYEVPKTHCRVNFHMGMRWCFFPYGIRSCGGPYWEFFNRDYKPLSPRPYLEADNHQKDFQDVDQVFRLSGSQRRKIMKMSQAHGERMVGEFHRMYIWFYNDGNHPNRNKQSLDRYLEILGYLLTIGR